MGGWPVHLTGHAKRDVTHSENLAVDFQLAIEHNGRLHGGVRVGGDILARVQPHEVASRQSGPCHACTRKTVLPLQGRQVCCKNFVYRILAWRGAAFARRARHTKSAVILFEQGATYDFPQGGPPCSVTAQVRMQTGSDVEPGIQGTDGVVKHECLINFVLQN